MRISTLSLASLTLLPLLAVAGCGNSRKDALAFNEALVNANRKLELPAKEFLESLPRAITGGPADAAQVKQLYEKTRQAMQQVKADMESVHVPSSQSAQALYEAHQKYLQGEERLIEKDFAEVVKLLENSKLGAAEKAQKVNEILVRGGTTEQADLAVLKSAQRNFAQDNHLTLQ